MAMGVAASSFEVRGGSTAAIVQAALRATERVTKPSCRLVFSSGAHATQLLAVARRLHREQPNLPTLLMSGPGVLTERGELEGGDATTGIVWSGGQGYFRTASDTELSERGLGPLTYGAPEGFTPHLVFIRSEAFKPDLLTTRYVSPATTTTLFGAGTHGDPGLICCDAEGVRPVAAAVVHLRGLSVPRVQTAHSCRLLSHPLPITRSEGSMVFELGGEAALSVLERLGANLSGRPLLFTVLAQDGDQVNGEWLVRGIQGIDPARRALVVSNEVRPGMRMTFAIKDARAAREDIERRCRQVAQELNGAAPRFALYFNCSARGSNLHTRPDVDTRLLRERFPNVPVAGFHSAFEIAPFDGVPVFQIYTGVIAMFSSPS